MYESVLKQMKIKEKSIYGSVVEGSKIMVARKACHDLYDTLDEISFSLQGTTIHIQPRGYLYHMRGQNDECFIGIESIPDNSN